MPDGMCDREGVYYAQFRANGREVRKRLWTDFRAVCEMLNELRSRADKAGLQSLVQRLLVESDQGRVPEAVEADMPAP